MIKDRAQELFKNHMHIIPECTHKDKLLVRVKTRLWRVQKTGGKFTTLCVSVVCTEIVITAEARFSTHEIVSRWRRSF